MTHQQITQLFLFLNSFGGFLSTIVCIYYVRTQRRFRGLFSFCITIVFISSVMMFLRFLGTLNLEVGTDLFRPFIFPLVLTPAFFAIALWEGQSHDAS